MTLEISPTAPCWVSVTADGRRAFHRVMQPGQRILRILDTAVIEVGDAGAFAFWINGKPGRPAGAAGSGPPASPTRTWPNTSADAWTPDLDRPSWSSSAAARLCATCAARRARRRQRCARTKRLAS